MDLSDEEIAMLNKLQRQQQCWRGTRLITLGGSLIMLLVSFFPTIVGSVSPGSLALGAMAVGCISWAAPRAGRPERLLLLRLLSDKSVGTRKEL